MLWWTIRNFFIKPFFYTGPTLIACVDNEIYENKLTVGKIYYSEYRDGVAYYLVNDKGEFDEIVNTKFVLLKKLKKPKK